MWIISPIAGLIEPAIAPELYIDGIGAIELLGSAVRIYPASEQLPLEAGGSAPNKIVAVKLVAPLTSIPHIIGQLALCLRQDWAKIGAAPPSGQFPRLVR